MKSDIKPLYDIDGNELNIGDTVLRPIYSMLLKCKIVNITNRGVRVSVYRGNIGSRNPTNNWKSAPIDDHNSTVVIPRIERYDFPCFLLLEKGNLSQEDIHKFNQVKYNESKS